MQILLLILGFILAVWWYGHRKKCPNCKKWNHLTVRNKVLAGRITNYRKETVTDRHEDRNGRVKGTTKRDVFVPYQVPYYNVTFKCRNCGCQVQHTLRNRKYLEESLLVFLLFVIVVGWSGQSGSIRQPDFLEEEQSVKISVEQEGANNVSSRKGEVKDRTTKKTDQEIRIQEVNTDTLTEEELPVVDNSENNEHTPEKSITAETPEYLRRDIAVKMLNRGKSIDEVADSTFLPKNQIRKLRRVLRKE